LIPKSGAALTSLAPGISLTDLATPSLERHPVPTFSIPDATQLAVGVLEAAGTPRAAARLVAAHLIDADACGYPSHGLSLLPLYVADLEAGRVDPETHGHWVLDAGPLLVFDAQRGLGRALVEPALRRAISAAASHGVAVLAVRQSHHLGRLGAYAEIAAASDLAALLFANVVGQDPRVAPTGAREARLSTNPIALAVPSLSGAPVLLDVATSGIAMNKVRLAQLGGAAIDTGQRSQSPQACELSLPAKRPA
jgi:LDH2 family malate/lactate/ureidoglycolate dehydrogenase